MTIDAQTYELCRYLSKSGDFPSESAYLKELTSTLSPEDAVLLYSYLRDHSERWESEWRPKFISLFPRSEPLLPEIPDAEYWGEELFGLIRAGDLCTVQAFIGRIGMLKWKYDPKETYQECASMGRQHELTDVPVDFYPVETENEDCITPVKFAQSLGQTAIAEYLQNVISEMDSKYIAAFEEGRRLQ